MGWVSTEASSDKHDENEQCGMSRSTWALGAFWGEKQNIKTWSVGLKGWGRKPGGCSGKSDVTGVIILGFCRALPGKFCRARLRPELLRAGFAHLHSLPRPFPPFLVHRAGISPSGDVWTSRYTLPTYRDPSSPPPGPSSIPTVNCFGTPLVTLSITPL